MNPVAIAKVVDENRNKCFRLVTDNGIVQYESEKLRKLINSKSIKIQNVSEVRDKNSALGVLAAEFTVGHGYPELNLYNINAEQRNSHKLTMLGYANTKNGKMFIVSDKDGTMFYVSNLEVKALEEFDLITNASYCKNGTVRLDGGTLEEVSSNINNFAMQHNVDFVKAYIDKLLTSEINRLKVGSRKPDFSKLDQLEKLLPNQIERKIEYNKMNASYNLYEPNIRGVAKSVGLFGLGALSFTLDSVLFAGKMKLGNAILDSVFKG